MVDIDAVRVANLTEALRQANRYLVSGLFSAVFLFALSLDPGAFNSSGSISLPGGLPPLPVRYARLALGVIYWVSPILADFSLARAERIGIYLQETNPELLKAAITFPSIATTRVHGPRWVTAFGPPVLVTVAGWMTGFFAFTEKRIVLFVLSVLPYMALFAFRLRRSFGDLKPDAYGD
jgi:hypothetical protein